MAKRDPVVNELILAGALEETQAQEAESLLQTNLEQGQQALKGVSWRVDQKNYRVSSTQYPEETERWSLELPRPKQRFEAENWLPAGSHLTLLQAESIKKAEDIAYSVAESYQLIQAQQGVFLNSNALKEHNLPLTQQFLTYATPKQTTENGPLDLVISPDQQWLALIDRSAGQVYMINAESGQLAHSFQVRKPGSSRGLMVCFREGREELVVLDNTSSVGVWSYGGEQIRKLTPGGGLLGNGVLAGDLLFAMATKPNPGLKVIELESGNLVKEIAIKGDLYSVDSDAPLDLMTLTPDGQNLLFMTYLNEPEPFTPVITVVDVARQKTTSRFAIKDGSRPNLLAFLAVNPLAQKNQSIVDLLLSMELISADDLHAARIAVREKERQAVLDQAASAPLLDLDQRAFEEAQREKEEGEEQAAEEATSGEAPKFKPEKAPQMNISPVADELITDACVNSIYRQSKGEIDLKNNAELAEPLGRLKAAATRARHELEWHTGAIIKLKKLVGEMNFEQVITREEMEQMLHKHERDSLVQSGMPTVPSNCPNCSKPLFGSYVCSYCGYEIERPEELLKRGLISIASIRPLDNLPVGHFLLIDMEGKRILEIDTQRNISWSMGKDILSESSLELEFPRDAARLATRNTLITDYSQNRIVEITPSGRVFWDYKPHSDEGKIKNPVRATANGLNHVLIVDQGRHRVIEVDRASEILMQYGHTDTYGIDEGMLNMPSDIQRLVNGNLLITDTGNHRVIELEDYKVVWQYGNPENLENGGYGSEPGYLSYPQSALRSDNGNTLIVDAGNMRVFELSPENEVLWEFKTNEGPEEHQMDSPFRASPLPGGLVMVLSETSILEYDPQKKEVVWACQLSEFERATITLKPEQEVKRFLKHGVQNPYMRFKQDDKDPSAEAQSRLQDLINKRLSTTRQASTDKAHITRFGDVELVPLDFFIVDRSKNKVLRVNREGQINWRYGEKEGQLLFKPHACTKTPEGHVLIVDTDQHRILQVNPENSEIVWSFGEKNKPETAERGVNRPRFAQYLPNGHLLIVDQNNRRVFEMKKNRQIVWIYEGMDHLLAPYHAERLGSGNTLITDWGAHQVFEITPAGERVWSFGVSKTSGQDEQHLSYPEQASRLENGNTLISDTRNNRVLEVSPEGKLVWLLDGQDSVKYGSPTYARRLPDGHTLVLHSSNRQMLEVDAKFQLYWKLMLPFEKTSLGSKPGA